MTNETEKEVASRSLLEQDVRDTDRMCGTLELLAEKLEREGKLPPRKPKPWPSV